MKRVIFTVFYVLTGFISAQSQWLATNGPFGGQIVAMCKSSTEIFVCTNTGVFMSTDSAATWIRINDVLSTKEIYTLYYANGKLYAGGYNELYEMSLPGNTWKTLNCGGGVVRSICKSGSRLFVAASFGLRVSDNGTDFSAVNNGNYPFREAVFVSEINGTLLLNASDIQIQVRRYFRSVDNGVSWQEFDVPGGIRSVHPMENKLLIMSITNNAFFSYDNGLTMTNVGQLGLDGTLQDISTLGSDYIVTTDHGVFKSDTSTIQWTVLYTGKTTGLLISNNNLFLGLNGQGILASPDKGMNWKNASAGLSSPTIKGIYNVNGLLQLTTSNGGSFQSTDKGANWTNFSYYQKAPDCFAANSAYHFYGNSTGIFRSADGINNWTGISASLSEYNIKLLTIQGNDLYAVAGAGRNTIYKSSDNGDSWKTIGIDTALDQVKFIGFSNGRVWVANHNAVYIFQENGDSWNFVRSTLPYEKAAYFVPKGDKLYVVSNCIFSTIDEGYNWYGYWDGIPKTITGAIFNGNTIIAATSSGGVYKMRNSDLKWESISEGLPEANITSITMDETHAYVGTPNSGVYKRRLSEMTTGISKIESINNPESRVYPNPASGLITLQALPGVASVNLLDISGRQINTYPFSGQIDLTQLGSGIYWVQFIDVNDQLIHGERLMISR